VVTVDGHDISELCSSLTGIEKNGYPKAVIARTVKGKGVSFMENSRDWHHNRLTQSLYEQAVAELRDAQ
jgi:transketolase